MADTPPDQQKGGGGGNDPQALLDRAMVRWTRAVAIFTFFLVVASGVSDWFIYQQYKVANDAQFDTRAQLKAVVSFNGGGQAIVNNKDGKPAYYAVIPTFQNYGGTRTAHFNGWANIHFFEGSVPNNTDFSKPFDKIDVAEAIIGPNSIYQFQPLSFTADQVARADRKEGVLLFWGHADWSDIFEPTSLHPISFCIQFTPTTATTDGKTILLAAPYRNDCNISK